MLQLIHAGGFLATGEHIKLVQMVTQKVALRLEIAGLKRSGRSIYSIVKQQYNFKGSKQRVLAQLEALIETTREKLNDQHTS